MKTKGLINKTIMQITLIIALIFFTPLLHAQQDDGQMRPAGEDKKDKIEAIHTAYITQKINLTSEQAQKFWPVYDQYRSELDELNKQRRKNAENVKKAGIDNMSDADVQKLVASEIDIESRELELRKKYVVKFQEVITLKQVAKLFIAEQEFKLYLLNQLKNRRNNQRGGEGDY